MRAYGSKLTGRYVSRKRPLGSKTNERRAAQRTEKRRARALAKKDCIV